MKYLLTVLTAAVTTLCAYAQDATLSGRIVNSATSEPVNGVTVSLVGHPARFTTGPDGTFSFDVIDTGVRSLRLTSPEIVSRDIPLNLTPGENNIGDVRVVFLGAMDNLGLIGVIDEAAIDEDSDDKSQDVSTLVIISNDPYISTTSFHLSNFRFRLRNYESRYTDNFINGVNFNDQNRGQFSYASIGALNDVTHNGDAVNYFNPGSFSFGNIGGSENINMRAADYVRGAKFTATYTNRTYYLRAMASYSTGLMENGWAFTFGAGMRYSDEGNISGTFYRNAAYMFGMEKQWRGGIHRLAFTTYGSPVERGQQGSTFQEVYDLVDNNLYNPYWGYQDGKKRNQRVVKQYDPTGILSHIWQINDDVTLTTGLGVHYNRYGSTALNWYNGADPRPDYYRYLPSYYRDNEDVFNYYTDLWKSKDKSFTQVNWDEMYRANQLSVRNGDGSSIYMIEERRNDLFETTFNSTINARINERSRMSGGIEYRYSLSKQFKTVDDLMGGIYVMDYDKFSEQDFKQDQDVKQNDLNRPDRKVFEGDTFGYDFRLHINSAKLWFQNEYTTRKIDYYYAASVGWTEFQREGMMRNGRYPNNSYGRGKKHDFVNYGIKAGMTAKITGRHLIQANVSYRTDNPLPNNSYVSPRITDYTLELDNEKIFSVDVSYIFSLPSFSGRISAYQTNFFDQTDRWSYYHNNEKTFVNYVVNGIDKMSRGVEFGFKYKLDGNWSFDLAGTVSEYIYTNNPNGVLSYENGSRADIYEKTYLKDLYVGGMPQFAGTIGVNYFYNYWFFSVNLNGIARNHVEVAPDRRRASNYVLDPNNVGMDPNNPDDMAAFLKLTEQERFKEALTLDLSIGKILYLRNRHSMNFNLSVNNILNKKDVRTGGYEQGRSDISYPDRFGSKYYYMQGLNCFFNVSYRF